METDFDYFLILAGMRTGSNYLESSLNAYDGIECLGEVFNPHFVGGLKRQELFGISRAKRESDPYQLIEAIKKSENGLAGFRFFFDHDPRILEYCLADQRCAKVILTRNLVDTYLSREIARKTDQWRLGKMQDARTATVKFEAASFSKHVTQNRDFFDRIDRALQLSGQTAFRIGYEELSDADVLNGLARYLGAQSARKKTSKKTKKQNPLSRRDKVSNYAAMEKTLVSNYMASLEENPNFEQPRGPAIPTYIACEKAPLLFMPIKSGPTDIIRQWLADVDGSDTMPPDAVFNQKTLRQWKRNAKGHRSFTVIRHPVARLHDAFVRRILMPGPQSYPQIRATLVEGFGLELPGPDDAAMIDANAQREAFLAFAKIIQGNLSGQTNLRVDSAWASQSEILKGMADFAFPDFVFREPDLADQLDFLAAQVGFKSPKLTQGSDPAPNSLAEIYDDRVEKSVRSCYQRDYMMFGFSAWK